MVFVFAIILAALAYFVTKQVNLLYFKNNDQTATLRETTIKFKSKEQLADEMDKIYDDLETKLNKDMPKIQLISNFAALAGLVGTVLGLVDAFSGNMQGGVDAAMMATAYGCCTAFPGLIIYAIFTSRIQEIQQKNSSVGLKLYVQADPNKKPSHLRLV